MRTIIAGSRDFDSYHEMVRLLPRHEISVVISGKARGADRLGERWAISNGVPVEGYPAQWDLYGKSAGYRRNEEMARNAEQLIAFWDGKSRGTKHMIDIALRHNLRVTVYKKKGD